MLMFIYIMRNTKNNKVYVGQDSGQASEMRRVKVHIADAKRLIEGKKIKCASKIAAAIAKYGIENFEVTVDSCDYKTKHDLDAAEIKLIAKFDCIKNGYNIMPGGQGFPSNEMIDDLGVREFLKEIRSKGAKIANANRWGDATPEERKIWRDRLIIGRTEGDWQKNIQASWDRLTVEERTARGNQMKLGRPNRFVLMDSEGKEVQVETNLRSLLSGLVTKTPKRQIERIVRNDNYYSEKEFSIEKRHR
jgi:group I intron endonuclease